MAKCVDAVAIDMGDGAVGPEREIAGHELDADHGPRLEIGGIAHARRNLGAPADALARLQPESPKLGAKSIERGAAETAEGDGRSDIDHALTDRQAGRGSGKHAAEIAIEQRDRRRLRC